MFGVQWIALWVWTTCCVHVGAGAKILDHISKIVDSVDVDLKITSDSISVDIGIDPWTVNQNVCPPILCGGGSGPLSLSLDASVALEPTAAFPFFEGDIVLDSKQQADKKKRRRPKRSIIKPSKKHWKNARVPYTIDQSLDDDTQSSLSRAHRHIERRTCIRFHPQRKSDEDFIAYINQPGCWSSVGKIGGQQYVSLGHGCGQVGTAIHETCHALGFWHEQSRQDRDRYVTIMRDNIPKKYHSQFGKRTKAESYSLGYVYDYNSIMHYGDKYFSDNGRDTIKVKGIGETLGFKIGQRKELSEIDAAQLNDMYNCNDRDQHQRVCGKGWEPYFGRCYKFVADDPQTYAGARRGCLCLGAGLAQLTSPDKDRFVKEHLQDFHRTRTMWRVGARRIDDVMTWEDASGSKTRPMTYSAWHRGFPGSYTTTVLATVSKSNDTFVWKATWAGSSVETPNNDKFAFPYICEKKDYKCAKGWVNWSNKCYLMVEKDKRDLERAHKKCASQGAHLVHINTKEEGDFLADHLQENHRATAKWRTGGIKQGPVFYWSDNPSSDKGRLRRMDYTDWAPGEPDRHPTMLLSKQEPTAKGEVAVYKWKAARRGNGEGSHEFAFICEKEAQVNCFNSSTGNGRDFRGQLMYTETGVTCQSWTSQYPQAHDYMTGNVGRDRREGLGEHNYCRNPYGRRARPWCYVPLRKTKWQYCDISICR